ncbi:MAG: response regulator [Ekhidna sp.]|nr:response regulator [Ekhidna sp.]
MKNAIIVEDNLIPSLSMESMLRSKGYEVVGKLVSGEGAIDLVKDKSPTLIIMDIRIEGDKDGIDLAAEIRDFSEVPIMFVSALTDAKTLERIETISNSTAVSKPFSEKDFIGTLNKLLDE